MSIAPTQEFLDLAANGRIEFEIGELDQLARFLELLLATNEQFNLTAITDPAAAWVRHIFDSLTLLPFVDAAGAQRVADVGSGGGLPGIPLAIILPAVEFTLIEATGKKARFLEQAARSLGLANVQIVNQPAEVAGRDPAHRERYDIVAGRAVGKLATLLELTVPLARVHGHVLAIKGERAAEEIAAARQALHMLHARVLSKDRTATGTIIAIEKLRKSPRAYPRQPGLPRHDPLK